MELITSHKSSLVTFLTFTYASHDSLSTDDTFTSGGRPMRPNDEKIEYSREKVPTVSAKECDPYGCNLRSIFE